MNLRHDSHFRDFLHSHLKLISRVLVTGFGCFLQKLCLRQFTEMLIFGKMHPLIQQIMVFTVFPAAEQCMMEMDIPKRCNEGSGIMPLDRILFPAPRLCPNKCIRLFQYLPHNLGK